MQWILVIWPLGSKFPIKDHVLSLFFVFLFFFGGGGPTSLAWGKTIFSVVPRTWRYWCSSQALRIQWHVDLTSCLYQNYFKPSHKGNEQHFLSKKDKIKPVHFFLIKFCELFSFLITGGTHTFDKSTTNSERHILPVEKSYKSTIKQI